MPPIFEVETIQWVTLIGSLLVDTIEVLDEKSDSSCQKNEFILTSITKASTYISMVSCQKGPTRHAYAW